MTLARPILLGLVALLASVGAAQSPDRLREMLRKSMGRSFSVNVVSIIQQRDPAAEGTYQRIKVERSTGGKVRHTVLAPLRMAGIESVDDGQRSRVFLPDEKTVIDQPSPHQEEGFLDRRLALVQRNYRLRSGGRTQVAGRPAIVVIAVPRHPELETRRYTLDETTSYPLRMESVDDDGRTVLFYDTKDIRYPTALDPELFQLRPLGRVARVRYDAPETFATSAAVQASLGFRPQLPEVLPMGFELQEIQDIRNPKWRAVAIRMTDGLVQATMYQWRATGGGAQVKAFMDRTVREYNGLHLLLVSDLGPKQRERLMEAFLRRMQASPTEPVWITEPWISVEIGLR